jgi:hypothetical protein
MARRTKYGPEVVERARQLHAAGKSRETIQATLAAEGHPVSGGWVSNNTGDVPLAAAPVAPPAPVAAPLTADAVVEAAVAAVEDPRASLADVRAALAMLITMLRDMLERDGGGKDCPTCGRGESNIEGVTKIGRVLSLAGSLVVKTEPDVVADPNEAPDYVAAARGVREKWAGLVERALADRGVGL